MKADKYCLGVWRAPIFIVGDNEWKFIQSDGSVGDFSISNQRSWYKTREKARRAIQRYKEIQNRPKPKSAVVTPMFSLKEFRTTFIKFDIADGICGSEPCFERSRDETMIAVGMVLKTYGVTDFTLAPTKSY